MDKTQRNPTINGTANGTKRQSDYGDTPWIIRTGEQGDEPDVFAAEEDEEAFAEDDDEFAEDEEETDDSAE